MIQHNNDQANYISTLGEEVDEILHDPTFLRSPIQAKLLTFLCDKAKMGGPPPTQYEVAVEGLGRDPDSDFTHDSYPRVQVSRLRSNIEAHYSRNRPLNGFRVIIKNGSYQLDLEPETARVQPQTSVQNNTGIQEASNIAVGTHANNNGEDLRTRDLIMAILSRPGPLLASYVMTLLTAVGATLGVIAMC